MLYMIGGASRAGKSTAARRLLTEHHVPYLPTDMVMMALAQSMPGLGIDPDQPAPVRGEQLWPVLRAMAVNTLENNLDYLLEGDVLLPGNVAALESLWPGQIRACFIGYTDVLPAQKLAELRGQGDRPGNRWLRRQPDAYVLRFITVEMEFSRLLRAECAALGLAYFDTSRNFVEVIDDVVRYLGQ
jgi:hypothetical protein